MQPSPGNTQMSTLSHTHTRTHSHRHTYNIDTEGIPSSSLIQASADWGLDWMERVRKKGEMSRCAGERALGLKVGGERGWEEIKEWHFPWKYPCFPSIPLLTKGGLFGTFGSVTCAALRLFPATLAWLLLCVFSLEVRRQTMRFVLCKYECGCL